MNTFDIVFSPVTNPDSILYNENLSVADRFENALKDQVVFRDIFVKYSMKIDSAGEAVYGNIYSNFSRLFKSGAVGNSNAEGDVNSNISSGDYERENRLTAYQRQQYSLTKSGAYYRLNDTEWMIDKVKIGNVSEDETENIKNTVSAIEKMSDRYPHLKFYGYFVTQADDMPWYSEYLGVPYVDRYEYIAQLLPDYVKLDRMYYNDIEDYKELHYKSDHHWAMKGSARGYEQIYDMLSKDISLSPIKQPIKTWDFSGMYGIEYRGSRASKLQSLYSGYDNFSVYEYDLCDREMYAISPSDLEVHIPVRLSLFEEYKSGNISTDKYADHYVQFYGTATGTENNEKYYDSDTIYFIKNKEKQNGSNLLIVGDSNMRALRDVLASHFDSTVYLDYRVMGIPKIEDIIDKFCIDTVLIATQNGTIWYDGNKGPYSFNFSDTE